MKKAGNVFLILIVIAIAFLLGAKYMDNTAQNSLRRYMGRPEKSFLDALTESLSLQTKESTLVEVTHHALDENPEWIQQLFDWFLPEDRDKAYYNEVYESKEYNDYIKFLSTIDAPNFHEFFEIAMSSIECNAFIDVFSKAFTTYYLTDDFFDTQTPVGINEPFDSISEYLYEQTNDTRYKEYVAWLYNGEEDPANRYNLANTKEYKDYVRVIEENYNPSNFYRTMDAVDQSVELERFMSLYIEAFFNDIEGYTSYKDIEKHMICETHKRHFALGYCEHGYFDIWTDLDEEESKKFNDRWDYTEFEIDEYLNTVLEGDLLKLKRVFNSAEYYSWFCDCVENDWDGAWYEFWLLAKSYDSYKDIMKYIENL